MSRLFGALLLISTVVPVDAQPVEILSTIGGGLSSATLVEDRIRQFAARDPRVWQFREGQPCEAIPSLLAQPRPVAVLTTAACWPHLAISSGTGVSASVGAAVYLFALRGLQAGTIADGADVGMLGTAVAYRERVQRAIAHMVGRSVDVFADSSTEAQLVARLKSRAILLAAIVEDGTGSGTAAFWQAARNATNIVDVVPFDVPSRGPARPDPRVPSAPPAALALPADSLPPPLINAPLRPSTLIALPFFDLDPSARRDSPVTRYARWIPDEPVANAAQGPLRSEAPLRVVLPMLIVKGTPPALEREFADALMAAPIDALVNPCESASQDVYRAFLRSAGTSGVLLWEHARMLESMNGPTRLAFAAQRERVESTIGRPPPPALPAGECRLPWRAFFRNDKLAYYQQAVNWLRDALDERSGTPASRAAALDLAAVCLGRAFQQFQGAVSSCGERTSGAWTAYYAPFLAEAVISRSRAAHGKR